MIIAFLKWISKQKGKKHYPIDAILKISLKSLTKTVFSIKLFGYLFEYFSVSLDII